MKKFKLLKKCLLAAALGFGMEVSAKESTIEKAETEVNKTVDAVKGSYRNGKDEICEMVNGKMACVGKKIKNKANNLSDKIETKATEVKNKID